MAMLASSCRLKVALYATNVHEILRSVLIKTNTEAGRTFLTSKTGTIGLDRAKDVGMGHRCWNTKDVEGRKLWSRKSLNGENVFILSSPRNVYTDHRNGCVETPSRGKRASSSNNRSPVPSQFTLPMICRSWKGSKELGPSTVLAFARKLSNCSNICFPMSNPRSSGQGALCRSSLRSGFRRRFSDEEAACKNTNQSRQCDNRETKREICKDCYDSDEPSKYSVAEFYPECLQPCEPSLEDPCCRPRPPPVCVPPKYSSCPNIDDYCPKEEMLAMKLWRSITIFFALPLVFVMSVYVYTRVLEKRKQPRPPFVDVPYLRRIIKPFPWGDGRHTLFHNPRINPISPEGYEVEDPNAMEESQPED